MSRKWIAAAALAAAAATIPTASAFAAGNGHHPLMAAAPNQAGLPAALQVPAGNHLVVSLHVIQGVQVYSCSNGSWTLQEPDANMGVGKRPTVLYTAGPEWVSTVDGSAVWGMPLNSVNRTGAVPELLVKAVKNRGDGLFGSVDYIQRLDTFGGLPPSGTCTSGAITASQYFATENFWAPGASD